MRRPLLSSASAVERPFERSREALSEVTVMFIRQMVVASLTCGSLEGDVRRSRRLRRSAANPEDLSSDHQHVFRPALKVSPSRLLERTSAPPSSRITATTLHDCALHLRAFFCWRRIDSLRHLTWQPGAAISGIRGVYTPLDSQVNICALK